MRFIYFILLFSLLSLSSCDIISKIVANSIANNYEEWLSNKKKIEELENKDDIDKPKAENIYLFREGDSLDFEYIVLGAVSGEAATGAKEYMAESYMKYSAWENYANGIIEVKVDSSQILNKIKKIQGKAVKINQDSLFFAKYGKISDLNFLDDLNIKRSNGKSAIKSILITIGVIYGIMALFAIGFLIYMISTGRPPVNR